MAVVSLDKKLCPTLSLDLTQVYQLGSEDTAGGTPAMDYNTFLWTKQLRKFSCSSSTSKQANDHFLTPPPPPPLTQCYFLGHKQFPGNQHFPNQHWIGGEGRRSNCGRIQKGGIVIVFGFLNKFCPVRL